MLKSGWFDNSLYSKISKDKPLQKIEAKKFSYEKMIYAFFIKDEFFVNEYISYIETFEIFNQISENSSKFDISLLFNNSYIKDQYLKLTEEQKNILRHNKNISNMFNEIDSIFNLNNF